MLHLPGVIPTSLKYTLREHIHKILPLKKDSPKLSIKLYNGDCLDVMKQIPDKSIDLILCDLPLLDEQKIVELYTVERYTLRHIADEFHTNHHMIKRILQRCGVEITRRNTLKVFSEEHRKKLSDAGKGRPCWATGKKMTRNHILKNMRGHLKYDVSLEWLESFDDIEILKFLNHTLSRSRDYIGFDTTLYMQYIEKFYYDPNFNKLYTQWIETNDKWMKPSLDHIQPVSLGGSKVDLNNMQFISWFENHAKLDIPAAQWNNMKLNIAGYFV